MDGAVAALAASICISARFAGREFARSTCNHADSVRSRCWLLGMVFSSHSICTLRPMVEPAEIYRYIAERPACRSESGWARPVLTAGHAAAKRHKPTVKPNPPSKCIQGTTNTGGPPKKYPL